MSVVHVERSGNLCMIKPWVPSLKAELTFTRMEREQPKPGRTPRMKKISEKLYKVEDSVGYFPGGVYHRVWKHLTSRGYSVEFKDNRDLNKLIPHPDFTYVEPLREDQPEVLVKIATQSCGIIVCNTGWGKSFLIKQICIMYPTLKIVIISPGRAEIQNIYDRIIPVFPAGTVGMIGCGKKDSNQRRIICTTSASIMHADLQGCDLILFDEVHACGYNRVADALRWVGDARMFGFTASPVGRSDGCEMIGEAFFGPVIADFEYADSVKKGTAVPIEAHIYEVPGAPIYKKTPVAKKRVAYWRNTVRNYMIAYLASKIPPEEQTLIMVETVEHGMYLKKLLPEYTFVHGPVSPDEYDQYTAQGFTADPMIKGKGRDAVKEAFASGELKKAIATGVWKQAVKSAPLVSNCKVKKYSSNCWDPSMRQSAAK